MRTRCCAALSRCCAELYRILLEAAGYEVRAFTDRVEALTTFFAANPQPDLLITDYDGYPISAEQLMQCCRAVQPGLKILMVSGYGESCLSSCRVMPDRFLKKPFSNEVLLDEVQSLIRKSRNCDSAIRTARFLNARRIE
jgi:DNA-binding NtrC family response regulator